jgi:hypothetical protein
MSLGRDFVGVDSELLDDDLLNAVRDIILCHFFSP